MPILIDDPGDQVVYLPRSFFLTQNTTLDVLNGKRLTLTGEVYLNGGPVGSGGGGAVSSVNGEVGIVQLIATEIPTDPAGGWGVNNVEAVLNYLNGQLGTKSSVRRPVVANTSTLVNPVIGDENTFTTLSNAGVITVTLPSNATSAVPIGAEMDYLWLGVGQPTFISGSGATVNGTPGLKLRAQYSAATAKKISTNGWVVIGDLSA